MEPGIYPNIPFSEYIGIEAVSNSYLGRLNECPAKGLIPRKDTDSLGLGRAVHTMVLEGEEVFKAKYTEAIKVNKRTNAGKAEWAAFVIANAGQEIVTSEDIEKAEAIRKAVFAHPMARKLLAGGVQEQTLIWEDKETGLLCKGRPDFVPGKDTFTLIDLKTARNVGERAFTRSIIDYGYARQGAFYIDGYGATTKIYIDAFVIIAVEPEPPHRVECYVVDDEFITWGRSEYKRLLRIHKRCKETGVFPHYQNEGITQIYKPTWL